VPALPNTSELLHRRAKKSGVMWLKSLSGAATFRCSQWQQNSALRGRIGLRALNRHIVLHPSSVRTT
jgi:hypothetical protein